MGKNKLLLPIILIIFAASVVFCALTLRIGFAAALKLFSSFLLVFFVPGIVWGFAIFRDDSKISWLLRIIFAFAFSILSVPLLEFYLNRLLKIEITRRNILIEIIVFSFLGLFIYFVRSFKIKAKKTMLFLAIIFLLAPLSAQATVLPFDYSSQKIIKVAGDRQVIIIGRKPQEVKARVIDENNNPLPGTQVVFTLFDEKGNRLGSPYATITDRDGFAVFNPKIANAGKYSVKAEINNGSNVIFNLDVKVAGGNFNYWWLLLILIPLLILIFWLALKPRHHLVYDADDYLGIESASVITMPQNTSRTWQVITDKNGRFRYKFNKGNHLIKIKKEGWELLTLDNHPEFLARDDGWFYFAIKNKREPLRFAIKSKV